MQKNFSSIIQYDQIERLKHLNFLINIKVSDVIHLNSIEYVIPVSIKQFQDSKYFIFNFRELI